MKNKEQRRQEAMQRAVDNWARNAPDQYAPQRRFETLEDYVALFDGSGRKPKRIGPAASDRAARQAIRAAARGIMEVVDNDMYEKLAQNEG